MGHTPEVEAKPWGDFLPWFGGVWKPGEHLSVIAPTGAGKTTFVGGVLEGSRNYILAFDPKGGDSTLRGLGWPRLPSWPPPPAVYKDIEEGRPARFLVGPTTLQLLADRRMMNLGPQVERLLIAARDLGLSVVTAYQRPANVPRTAADQATWVAVSYTRDKDVVDRVAEMLGRPKPEIRGLMAGLEPYTWGVVGRNPRLPMILTRPPEITRRKTDRPA